MYYQTHGLKLQLQKTLQEPITIAIKQAGEQFTGLAGDGDRRNLFGGVTGRLIGTGLNASVDKIIDIFISNDNEMGMMVAEVQDGEALQVPAGSHDVLFSFGGVLDRAIERNIR